MTKRHVLSPAAIDGLVTGALMDPMTPGLRIEAQSTGRKIWKYERRVSGSGIKVRLTLGSFPAWTMAAAREWATGLNEKIETGIDPREEMRAEEERSTMTVARAHGLYMSAVREGRASRAKRTNRPRTIADKLKIYKHDIAPTLAKRSMYDVTEKDLINLVIKKGKKARVRANRLAAELKVFFGWAASLRGLVIGLENDPSRRLTDLRFPEPPRTRKLSLQEIEWFLRAVVFERRDFRRGLILYLLTAVRFSELVYARREEIVDGVWTIPPERAKNCNAHSIALGPWGQHLMAGNSEWVFPAERKDGPRKTGWYPARDRVCAKMAEFAGRPIEAFKPHDFRRTARSNTKRLKVDFETAEAMLNHRKQGLERIYDGSTGFFSSLGFPEIVVFSLSKEVSHSILWDIFRDVQAGEKPLIGVRTADLLGNAEAALLPVSKRQYHEHLGWSRWFYSGDDFPCLQLVWPDREGRFPWEGNFDVKFKDSQPDLTDSGWHGLG